MCYGPECVACSLGGLGKSILLSAKVMLSEMRQMIGLKTSASVYMYILVGHAFLSSGGKARF